MASGEELELQLLPGFPGGGGSEVMGYVRLADPNGGVPYEYPEQDPNGPMRLAPLPHRISFPDSVETPGDWRIDIVWMSGHFQIDKLSGPDRNLYLTWLSAGYGEFEVSSIPENTAMSLTFVNNSTGEVFGGGLGANRLPPGSYTIKAFAGEMYVGTEAADLSCNGVVPITFRVPRNPPHVTGGGWFESRRGAFREDLAATGHANFGFEARYHAGKPAGQVEFHFQNGSLNFHSTDFDDLVVNERTASLKGRGTLNGGEGYFFIVNVTDRGHDGDRIRVQITTVTGGSKRRVVYDNYPDLRLGGGSIVIHR